MNVELSGLLPFWRAENDRDAQENIFQRPHLTQFFIIGYLQRIR